MRDLTVVIILLLASASVSPAAGAQTAPGEGKPPIIDMHMHALPLESFPSQWGNPPLRNPVTGKPSTATNNEAIMAVIEREMGQLDAAIADARHGVTLCQADLKSGAFSSAMGYSFLALAKALDAQGKHDEALAAARTAAEHFQHIYGPVHDRTHAARQLAGLEDPNGVPPSGKR